MARINREELLRRLDEVRPGLSPQPIVEQSSCVVLKAGKLWSYNEEVACRTPSGLPADLTGVVQAEPFIKILNKLPDTEVDIVMTDSELCVRGKGKEARLTAERDVLLPIDKIKLPDKEKWQKVHDDFTDAIGIAMTCVGKDATMFHSVCVNVAPTHIESCDLVQLTRYKIKTGVAKPFMVRGESVKHVQSIAPDRLAEDDTWLHFKGAGGLYFSVKKWIEDFPDLGPKLDVTGVPTTLPPGLAEAAERAEVFSSENADHNLVLVSLQPGKLRLEGTGASGRYAEVKRVKYNGKPIKFMVAPKLLSELVKRHTDCQVSERHRIKVDGGKFVYVAGLYEAGKKED